VRQEARLDARQETSESEGHRRLDRDADRPQRQGDGREHAEPTVADTHVRGDGGIEPHAETHHGEPQHSGDRLAGRGGQRQRRRRRSRRATTPYTWFATAAPEPSTSALSPTTVRPPWPMSARIALTTNATWNAPAPPSSTPIGPASVR